MSVTAVIIAAIVGWLVLGVLVALLIGRMVGQREAVQPPPAPPGGSRPDGDDPVAPVQPVQGFVRRGRR